MTSSRRILRRMTAATAVAVMAAGSAALASSPRHHGILEVNITHSAYYRGGEPEIAANPRNHDNLVYVATHHRLQQTPIPGVDYPPVQYQLGGFAFLGNG